MALHRIPRASPVDRRRSISSRSNGASIIPLASTLATLLSFLSRPVSATATQAAFIVVSPPDRLAFHFSIARLATSLDGDRRSGCCGVISSTFRFKDLRLAASADDEDDDDGWGAAPAVEEDDRARARELASLRSETNERRDQRQGGSVSGLSSPAQEEQERDLFIPVFSVVALMGLFGAYGYEMLRLYSRGELYLPWEQ